MIMMKVKLKENLLKDMELIIGFLFIGFYLVLPLVIPLSILAAIIVGLIGLIYLINSKRISVTFKILIIIMALLYMCVMILINFQYYEGPSPVYSKTKGASQRELIGLSKAQVTELFGKPEYDVCNEEKNYYKYNASVFKRVSLRKHTLWAETYYYGVYINFDKEDKVESIQRVEGEKPRGG